MKRPLTIALAVLLFVQASIAQRNDVDDIDRENFFRIGAKGGININKIPGLTYNQGFNFNYFIGGFVQFNFSKRFGIQPEVNFVQSTSTFTNDITAVTDDLFHGGTQPAAKLNYLEIPILLNMNLGQSRHVKLQLGPSYGMFLNNGYASTTEEPLQYKNGMLSAVGGLWIQLPFVYIGGRYQYGFKDIYDPLTKQTGKNQAIQIFTGFTF